MAEIVFANLSLIGLLDGLTAACIVIFSVLFGIISFYHARKLEAKLLAVAGLVMVFVGLFWLGPATDFFNVMLTGENLSPTYLYGWLSYMWITPAVIVAFYLGAELMVPEKKKIIVIFYGILGIIFEILLFSSPTLVFTTDSLMTPESGMLIDTSFNRGWYAFYIIAFFLLSILVFLVIGFAIKAKQATGELRKKFLFLFVGFLIFLICGIFDSLTSPEVYLVIWRGAMVTFALWMYLGLKT